MRLHIFVAICVYSLALSGLEAQREPTCDSNPCVHGKCIDLSKTITNWSKYLCECNNGWNGENCDIGKETWLFLFCLFRTYLFKGVLCWMKAMDQRPNQSFKTRVAYWRVIWTMTVLIANSVFWLFQIFSI
jgi:hypothetical protein